MHEWALAEAIVVTAAKVAKEQGLEKIEKIKIKLGELQQIDKKTFEFALKEIIRPRQPLFKKTEIDIQGEKALIKCRTCGKDWPFGVVNKRLNSTESEAVHFIPEAVHAYIRCPECKGMDFEVVQGRGMWIDSISGERAD